MAETLHIHQREINRIEEVRKRIRGLEPLLGLKRDETGHSLNRASLTNSFASRRLEQIRSSHPSEWNEYVALIEEEADLDEEIGVTASLMDELFPDEKDIDLEQLLNTPILKVVR